MQEIAELREKMRAYNKEHNPNLPDAKEDSFHEYDYDPNDPELIQKIISLRRDKHMSYRAIAEYLDLAVSTGQLKIKRIIARNAPELTGRGIMKRHEEGHHPEKMVIYREWIRLRRDDKLTYEEIAQATTQNGIKVTRERVRQILKELAPEITGPLYLYGGDYQRCLDCSAVIHRSEKYFYCSSCGPYRTIYQNALDYVEENKDIYQAIMQLRTENVSWKKCGEIVGIISDRSTAASAAAAAHRWCRYYEERLRLVQECIE